jgi:hypothetical protein
MTIHHYNWKNGPAELQQHSVAKLDVLRAYLIQYFKTLASLPQQDIFRLTLVDGFAGGGLYLHKDKQELVHGSPLVCLEAVKEAEYLLNQERKKPLRLDVDYIFVEENKETFKHLEFVLKNKGYLSPTTSKIQMLNGCFQDYAPKIIEFVQKKSPRNGRSIFILDQYGYTDVPTNLMRNIFRELPRAEIILTFNVDSLINFAGAGKTTADILNKIGIKLPEVFNSINFQKLKEKDKSWRFFIQSVLHESLITACNAAFFTPFFIRNSGGHGDYWLIHMSQRYKARDVMTEVHWQYRNNFIHYGGSGLDMFNLVGYDPNSDENFHGQSTLGFEFDDIARDSSIRQLTEEFPKLIYANEQEMNFEALFSMTCNKTPATAAIYREVLSQLVAVKEIQILAVDGRIRRNGNNIQLSDRIIPHSQRKLFDMY